MINLLPSSSRNLNGSQQRTQQASVDFTPLQLERKAPHPRPSPNDGLGDFTSL